ncbi:MAG: long-chain fatty acid--CoA ligase [Patescibacteria group bacterium]|nr:long-chain fatty acid--CoA ligase [Patescibacteria group bacterium]
MKDTIIDSFIETVEGHPNKDALIYRENHHYATLTYRELYLEAQKLAHALKKRGVKEGDRVVLVSENRPEWVVTDVAVQLLGAILVPIHSVLAASQIKTIVDEVVPKIIFVSDAEQLTKVLEIEVLTEHDTEIGYFDTDIADDDPMLASDKLFLFKNEVFDERYEPKLDPITRDPERVITIIYTSGTTGNFKGVELTNKNIMSNIKDVLSWVDIRETDKFLSILPLSHIFERTVGYYIPMVRGATIGYVLDPTKLAEVAKAEKPTIIIAVPRLFEKVYEGVQKSANKNVVKKLMFKMAFDIGEKMEKETLLYQIANLLVFRKVKKAFGGNIRFFVSGAATLPRRIGEFFDVLSIPVLEGYGLTETSPILSTNTVDKRKYGTIGRILPSIESKVVGDELYVRGPNVFHRYYKNPEKTKEAFTDDGWFKTGDLVKVDKEGFISFKSRKKEIIVLSTGKNIGPAIIEEKLEALPEVHQAFVFGDERKHIGALIVPNMEIFEGQKKEEIKRKLEKVFEEKLNKDLASYEQIKKFIVTKKPFTVENGQMTPTLKLRRKEIEFAYVKEIEALYNN